MKGLEMATPTRRVSGVEESIQGGSMGTDMVTPRRARFTQEFNEANEARKKDNKRKPLRKCASRYDLKIVVPPTEPAHALEALKLVLIDVWKVMKAADKRLVLYPWSNSAESRDLPGLTKVEEFPDQLPAIQEYFYRAFPRKAGGTMYVSVFLGHDRPFKELHGELDWWFVQQGFGWYMKALQCEKSSVIGWLLFSTIDMDRELLASEIWKMTGVTVGLRFRTISIQSKQTLSKDQQVGAIHIEVDDLNYFGDKARVEDLYRANRDDDFPLDIKMRLCPQIQDATDPSSIIKLERLRIRQAAFLANVQKTISGDIACLDFEDKKWAHWTLRKFIMRIRDDDGVRVFVSVDRHFTGRGFVYQYTSRFSVLAPAWIRGMIPYLKTQINLSYHEQLRKCFTLAAFEKAKEYDWDEDKKCVVSAADRAVDDLLFCLDLDEEFEFPDTDTKRFELDMSAVKVQQEKGGLKAGGTTGVNPYDSDSVSTMVSRHEREKIARKKEKEKSKEEENKNQEQEKTASKTTTAVNNNTDDKAAAVAVITGKLEELQKLARTLGVPLSSLQLGQAVDSEVSDVGDGDASGGRSA